MFKKQDNKDSRLYAGNYYHGLGQVLLECEVLDLLRIRHPFLTLLPPRCRRVRPPAWAKQRSKNLGEPLLKSIQETLTVTYSDSEAG